MPLRDEIAHKLGYATWADYRTEVKMAGTGEPRVESLRLADVFRARVVDSTSESFVFEVTGASSKIDAFIELMRPLGMVELARTGVVGVIRGKEPLEPAR